MSIYAADGPNAADWLEAWATLAGAILSAAAVLVAVLVLRRELNHRREDKDDSVAAQARLVLVSIVGAVGSRDEQWRGLRVSVSNNSPTSIFDVHVQVALIRQTGFGASEVSMSPIPGNITDSTEVLFAKPFPWPFVDLDPRVSLVRKIADAEVAFTDSVGIRWRRVIDRDPERRRSSRRSDQGLFRLLAEFLYLTKYHQLLRSAYHTVLQRLREALGARVYKRQVRELETSKIYNTAKTIRPTRRSERRQPRGAASE
ncbi:hypothetical protein [Actinoplanes sp. L3-i22]|uniref:hypothetical protein n=1 Tax=Actinoplanes sp. L3-i22 TaxID=2836373 RepID=UPI001C787BE4|nr:hypothetical protein [Actinoplanes sp. L3-i22]BCY11132.1 hypothetical protein L3i22_062200 [Actinoplanes sp. L3-i22]